VTQLLLVAYLLEAGLLLIVAPWSAFWDRNYFMEAWPALGGIATNNFVRGAISGVGAICLAASLVELSALVWRRRMQSWANGTERARP
jgi:hypothetical protein